MKLTIWMQIYVQLLDEGVHWHLMVVSILESKVYELDSFTDPGRDLSRAYVVGVVVKL